MIDVLNNDEIQYIDEAKNIEVDNYNQLTEFKNGFAKIYIAGKGINYINENNKLVSNVIWFKKGNEFDERGFTIVQFNDDEIYHLNRSGKLFDKNKNRLSEKIIEQKKSRMDRPTLAERLEEELNLLIYETWRNKNK